MFLTEELKKFHELHPKSKKIWQKALTVLPGGISHTIRTFELTTIGGFPVSIQSAYGPYMKDVDEIEYVDFWNGHQALILGHNHPEVRESTFELY